MNNFLILFFALYSLSLCAQKNSIDIVVYEGESYFLYPERQKINFGPTLPIWKQDVKLSKEELKRYKWAERRFFKEKTIVTKFPIDGKWIQLFDIDSLQVTKLFEVKNGLPNGAFKRFNKYNQLVEEGQFVNGCRSGTFYFYPDSTNYWGMEYSTGEYERSDSMYYKTAFVPYYHAMNLGRKGRWTSKGIDGSLIRIENYANGELDGLQTTYYNNNQTASLLNYQNGLMSGAQKFWHENGRPKEESNYNIGIKQGPFLSWYKDGKPKCNLEYDQDSIINGNCNLYYPSGGIFGKGKLEDHVRTGIWTFWHENGIKMAEGNYQKHTTNVCISGMARPYPHSTLKGRWNYWYSNTNLLASGDYDAIKKRISRGDIYKTIMIENSWACNNIEGNRISCDSVKELMDLNVEK